LNAVLAAIGRLIAVPIAFVLAMFAAGFVLFTLGMERFTHAIKGDWLSSDGMHSALALVSHSLIIASAVSLLPAILCVVIGEVVRIRSLLYYMVGGGFSMAAAPIAASMVESGGLALPHAVVWQVSATAGFFGGFVYWLLAGRWA